MIEAKFPIAASDAHDPGVVAFYEAQAEIREWSAQSCAWTALFGLPWMVSDE